MPIASWIQDSPPEVSVSPLPGALSEKKNPFLSGSAFSLGNKGALPRFRRAASDFFSQKNPDFFTKKSKKKLGSDPSEKSKDMNLNFLKSHFTNSIFQNFGFFPQKSGGGSEKP